MLAILCGREHFSLAMAKVCAFGRLRLAHRKSSVCNSMASKSMRNPRIICNATKYQVALLLKSNQRPRHFLHSIFSIGMFICAEVSRPGFRTFKNSTKMVVYLYKCMPFHTNGIANVNACSRKCREHSFDYVSSDERIAIP